MKPIENMNTEEIENLVSFKSNKGKVFFYSLVENFTDEGIIYNGKLVNTTSEESLKQLEEMYKGKMRFEQYKVFNSKEKVEKLAEEIIKEKLDNQFKSIFEETVSNFTSSATEFHNELNEYLDKSRNLNNISENTIGDVINIQKSLEDFMDKGNMKSLSKNIENVFNEFASFKKKHSKDIENKIKDFDDITHKLMELFNQEK